MQPIHAQKLQPLTSAGCRNRLCKMQISTLAALAYHKSTGRTAARPNQRLGFAENFLYMLDSNGNTEYRPNPKLARALEIMFILHQEHEMNCSTAACRHLASR